MGEYSLVIFCFNNWLQARRAQQNATLSDKRLLGLMHSRHPDGALGLDSAAVEHTQVYAAAAAAASTAAQARRGRAEQRRRVLARETVPEVRLQYDPLRSLQLPEGQRVLPVAETKARCISLSSLCHSLAL